MTKDGPDLLLEEIERRGLTFEEAGKQLGVSKTSVSFWVNRDHRPTAAKRELIEIWSNERVPRDAWRTPKERAALKAARKAARAA